MTLKDTIIAVFAVALIGALGSLWLAPAAPQQAPDITLTTLQGNKFSMPALRGRPVLVNFWATTCQPCVDELPDLIELYRNLSPRGFTVIGIAMAYDPPHRVSAFSKALQIPYPIALDINSDAARAFGDVRLTPTSFLVAPDGRIVQKITGTLDLRRVRAQVVDMLSPP